MWRKNRAVYPESECIGVDLNRNFDDHFGGVGTSDLPCDETYHGKNDNNKGSKMNCQIIALAYCAVECEKWKLTDMFSIRRRE